MRTILAASLAMLLLSCKPDADTKSEADFRKSISYLDSIVWPISTDSLVRIYDSIGDKEKIEFSKKVVGIYKNAKAEQDYADKRIKEREKELEPIREQQAAKEEAEWKRSKAGKLQSKHPDWTREECQSVVDKMVWIGMKIEMVVAERGNHFRRHSSNYGSGIRYQYCWSNYESSCFYCNEDGVVTSYN